MKKVNIKTVLKRVSFGFFSVVLMAGAVACSSDEPGNNDNNSADDYPMASNPVQENPMEGLNKTLFKWWDEVEDFVGALPDDDLPVVGKWFGPSHFIFKVTSGYGTRDYLVTLSPEWNFPDYGLTQAYEVPACGGDFTVNWFESGSTSPEVSRVIGWLSEENDLEKFTLDYLLSDAYYFDPAGFPPYTNYWEFTDEDKAEIVEVVDENFENGYKTTLRIPENRTGKMRRLFVYCSYWIKITSTKEGMYNDIFPIVQMP